MNENMTVHLEQKYYLQLCLLHVKPNYILQTFLLDGKERSEASWKFECQEYI